MKRYELECLKDHCGGQLAESADGNYVELADHEDAMASLQSDLDDMRKERDSLRAQLDEAREVLLGIEWRGWVGCDDPPGCPECWADRGDVHMHDCRLAAVLRGTVKSEEVG